MTRHSLLAGRAALGWIAALALVSSAAAHDREDRGKLVISSAFADANTELLTIRGSGFGEPCAEGHAGRRAAAGAELGPLRGPGRPARRPRAGQLPADRQPGPRRGQERHVRRHPRRGRGRRPAGTGGARGPARPAGATGPPGTAGAARSRRGPPAPRDRRGRGPSRRSADPRGARSLGPAASSFASGTSSASRSTATTGTGATRRDTGTPCAASPGRRSRACSTTTWSSSRSRTAPARPSSTRPPQAEVIPRVDLDVCRQDTQGQPLCFLQIRLTGAIVSSFSQGADLVDRLAFSYSQIEWTYQLFRPDGAAGGERRGSFDLATQLWSASGSGSGAVGYGQGRRGELPRRPGPPGGGRLPAPARGDRPVRLHARRCPAPRPSRGRTSRPSA